MTTRLYKKDLGDMAGSADDVVDAARAAGKAIADADPVNLPGWSTADAIDDIHTHWRDQAEHAAGRWIYFAAALRDTGSHIDATDKQIEFSFPSVGPGVKD